MTKFYTCPAGEDSEPLLSPKDIGIITPYARQAWTHFLCLGSQHRQSWCSARKVCAQNLYFAYLCVTILPETSSSNPGMYNSEQWWVWSLQVQLLKDQFCAVSLVLSTEAEWSRKPTNWIELGHIESTYRTCLPYGCTLSEATTCSISVASTWPNVIQSGGSSCLVDCNPLRTGKWLHQPAIHANLLRKLPQTFKPVIAFLSISSLRTFAWYLNHTGILADSPAELHLRWFAGRAKFVYT